MQSRIHKIPNSNNAFYFECYHNQQGFIKEIIVERFDANKMAWEPITFTLEPNMSNAMGIYKFNGPTPNITLHVQQGNDYYIQTSKIRYSCKANQASNYYIKEDYANSVFKEMFHAAHKQRLAKDSSCCFSFFYSCFIKTEVNENWGINDILKHAMQNNNRSQKICIDLGWLDADGKLTEKGKTLQKACTPPINKITDVKEEFFADMKIMGKLKY